MFETVLLAIHILAGSTALLAAVIPVVTKKGGTNHVRAGRVYALAMTVVFITALPLAILGDDIFLLIIGIFSFYLVFAGWRFARNSGAKPLWVDWTATSIMAATGLAMWVYGAVMGLSGDSMWVTLAVFGTIAVALSLTDAQYHRKWSEAAPTRIQRHLTNMLAGTIATITAVAVVNVDFEPAWIVWMAPTALITPLIVWWNIKLARRRMQGTLPNNSEVEVTDSLSQG